MDVQVVEKSQAVKQVEKKEKLKINKAWYIGLMLILMIMAILLSLTAGRYEITFNELLSTIMFKFKGAVPDSLKQVETILFQVRLPRVIAAVFIGAALSISGTAYQSMFKNPMVSPDILGVSVGAGFGAALGIIFNRGYMEIQILSFVFGLLAVTVTYIISHAVGKTGDKIIVLVLSGMVIRTVFQAFISITKYLADPEDSLPAITFWLMGSLSAVTLKDALYIGIPTIIGIIILMRYRWQLNVMALGDEEAASLGVETAIIRKVIIVASTIIVSMSISVCGTIGWVGLIIPHFARMIIGPDNCTLMPFESANKLETKTGIPVVMVDGGIDTYDEAYLFMGEVINRQEYAGELADFCVETLDHIAKLTENISVDMMKKVYYARGEDGLTTEPEGSVNQELLSYVSVVNIINEDMTQQSNAVVSIEQIMAADPDVILIGSAGFSIEGSLDYIENGIGWSNTNAVMNESVYKIPQLPFNWFDRPPSVNRIIGLEWLMYTLYPENYDKEFNQILLAYFDLFYHIELTEEQIQTLIR